MKVNELIEKLNLKMEVLVGTKTDMIELQHEVQRLIKPILIFNGMKYKSWEIIKGDNYGRQICMLDVDLKEDKRCTQERRGKILGIKFVDSNEEFLNIEVTDLNKYFQIKEKSEEVKGCEDFIKHLKLKLEQAEARKIELNKELNRLIED